jgi:hypothetical protein
LSEQKKTMPISLRSIQRLLGINPGPSENPRRNVAEFLTALVAIAPSAGRGDYGFRDAAGGYYGYVQFIICSPRTIEIHRLWTLEPGKGNGSKMLRAICDLADQHGVEIKLKVLPIGRKPYPLSREKLKSWYEAHGFAGPKWKLARQPVVAAN